MTESKMLIKYFIIRNKTIHKIGQHDLGRQNYMVRIIIIRRLHFEHRVSKVVYKDGDICGTR